jgi:hypothetical protein
MGYGSRQPKNARERKLMEANARLWPIDTRVEVKENSVSYRGKVIEHLPGATNSCNVIVDKKYSRDIHGHREVRKVYFNQMKKL